MNILKQKGRVYGAGHYKCLVIVVPVLKKTVAEWLPDTLSLGPQKNAPKDYHLINLLLGSQTNAGMNFSRSILSYDYKECAFVIPDVYSNGTGQNHFGPFLHIPFLYLDRLIPILSGRYMYGYPKQRGLIHHSSGCFTVKSGEVETVSASMGEYLEAQELMEAERLLAQPNICFPPWTKNKCYAYFDWNFSSAKLKRLSIELKVKKGLFKGFEGINLNYPNTSSIENGGAYEIETDWTLSLAKKIPENLLDTQNTRSLKTA